MTWCGGFKGGASPATKCSLYGHSQHATGYNVDVGNERSLLALCRWL